MEHPLHNPVYNALCTGDAALSFGEGEVKYFDEEVSPFAGFPEEDQKGFEVLHNILPAGRRILFARPSPIEIPAGWQLMAHVHGLQFIHESPVPATAGATELIALAETHVPEMIELTALTKPGPFGKRTIEFGHYHGVFENERLASMTGQRLHVANFSEVSAVCTHPDFLGKGYAAALLQHQLKLIRSQGQVPFLHVRSDNARAIALYERMGFKVSREMNFYFLKKS